MWWKPVKDTISTAKADKILIASKSDKIQHQFIANNKPLKTKIFVCRIQLTYAKRHKNHAQIKIRKMSYVEHGIRIEKYKLI